MDKARWAGSIAAVFLWTGALACGGADTPLKASVIGDAPALSFHTSQAEIESGQLDLDEIIARGKRLFTTTFNTLDVAGRPETTDVGDANTRPRREFPDNFNRISGPDANACAACHHLPRLGGGGDNALNTFTDADRLPFVTFDGMEGDGFMAQTLKSVGNERNPVGFFGLGLVELLAREMTVELQGIVDEASQEAQRVGYRSPRS